MRRPYLALLTGVSLSACGGEPPSKTEPPRETPLVAGAPNAGMAAAFLDLPVGAPLGGYTERCECFGGNALRAEELDNRDSAYVYSFLPSAGIQTRPHVVSLWLDNGDQAFVLVKSDAIYAFEGIVEELETRLSAETGLDLKGRVVLAVSHTHAAPANFDKGLSWFLGGDRFNPEIFERIVEQFTEISMNAYDSRQPAAIGIGQAVDWDPEDRVYHDRRPENDTLAFFDDLAPGPYKDPNLTLLRVDTAAGDPIGMLYAFGMHGTVLGGGNAMWSTEAAGHTELALMERFDHPMVVGMMQHGGGDASPSGVDREYARLESIGELSADAIYELWANTPTSSSPLTLETVTRAASVTRSEMVVTRDGTTDIRYAPYDETLEPDGQVFGPDGEVLSPIDEFNTEAGGAFCGDDSPLIPGVGIGSDVYPYSSCVDVETIAYIIAGFFGVELPSLPLQESLRSTHTASAWGPVSVRKPDGSTVEEDVLWGFFPGETTAMYTESFRRRARDTLGFQTAIPIGYSQDHEGYLLLTEDWLMGGYEPNINIWGPLQGEYILEQNLEMAGDILLTKDIAEDSDPDGLYQNTVYNLPDLETRPPETTPTAGAVLSTMPMYLWTPLDDVWAIDLDAPATVRRVQDGVQLVWEGGDPGVDTPEVVLEVRDDTSGTWSEVTTSWGHPITEALPDILLAHTPDPLYPWETAQTHVWWAGWQAVGHGELRTSLPTGTYRLHVYGQTYDGGGTAYPWPSSPYEVLGAEFEVVAAELSIETTSDGFSVQLPAPGWGYRLIDLDGDSRGNNPVRSIVLTIEYADGTTDDESLESDVIESGRAMYGFSIPSDAVRLTATDASGNTGSIDL